MPMDHNSDSIDSIDVGHGKIRIGAVVTIVNRPGRRYIVSSINPTLLTANLSDNGNGYYVAVGTYDLENLRPIVEDPSILCLCYANGCPHKDECNAAGCCTEARLTGRPPPHIEHALKPPKSTRPPLVTVSGDGQKIFLYDRELSPERAKELIEELETAMQKARRNSRLTELMQKAVSDFETLTREQQEKILETQRLSWAKQMFD